MAQEIQRSNPILLDIYYLSLLLIVATMPFSIQVNTLCITFSVFCWLALMFNSAYRQRLVKSLRSNTTAILFIVYALATTASVFIHFNSYEEVWPVLKTIERRSVFLFVPLILSGVVLLSRVRIKRLIMLFSQVMIVASLFCLAMAVWVTWKNGTVVHINPMNGIVENNFMYHRLVSYLGLHAVFFASQICFVFCFLMVRVFNERDTLSLKARRWFYLQLLFLGGMIVLLQSITISIIFLLLTLFVVLHYALNIIRAKQFTRVAVLILIVATIGAGYAVSSKYKDGTKLFEYDLSEYPGPSWNAVNIRLAIWDVNLKAVRDHWVWGVGPSNMNKTLDIYYTKYDFRFGIIDHLNPHNQFLHTLLMLGIGGLLILIALVVSIIRTAKKRKDIILGSLFFIFVLFSMTASTLSVNKGIVFFTFFLTLLTYLEGISSAYLARK